MGITTLLLNSLSCGVWRHVAPAVTEIEELRFKVANRMEVQYPAMRGDRVKAMAAADEVLKGLAKQAAESTLTLPEIVDDYLRNLPYP